MEHRIKEYVYRYIDTNKPVYVIKRIKSNNIPNYKYEIYSEPYYSKERKELRNAIIAYTNKDMCYQKVNTLKLYNSHYSPKYSLYNNNEYVKVFKEELIDLEGYCLNISMPLNVIINEYCILDEKKEYNEIFFYDSDKDKMFLKKEKA